MIGPKIWLLHARMSVIDDGMGGETSSWAVVQRMQGVLSPQNGNKTVMRDSLVISVTHRFFFDLPESLVPTEKDIFVSQDKTHTYEILFVNRPMSVKNFLVAELREMEKPLVVEPESVS